MEKTIAYLLGIPARLHDYGPKHADMSQKFGLGCYIDRETIRQAAVVHPSTVVPFMA